MRFLIAAAVLMLAGAGCRRHQVVETPVATPSEAEVRDRDIEFYERRVAEDSLGATDRSRLAGLYMQRARATGGFDDYARAESLAKRSLAIRTGRNAQTFELLASALLARHAFREALVVARRVNTLEPGVPAHVALLGEIELELGQYDSAATHFSQIRFDGRDFTIAARIARWREVTGHVDAARRLLRHAIKQVDRRDDLTRETRSWFHYRLGEVELRTGNLDSAAAAYQRGLLVFPEDYRILGGLARLATRRREWRAAIEYGNRAIAIQLDPLTLGTMSDAYAALGDSAQAAQYARAMAVSALKQPGPIDRAWGLWVLDHGNEREVARVLAKARDELKVRRDVYGYDLFAWALYRTGQYEQARAAIPNALAQGTEDLRLREHAGRILASR